jgi:hypothetical protein
VKLKSADVVVVPRALHFFLRITFTAFAPSADAKVPFEPFRRIESDSHKKRKGAPTSHKQA